MEGLHSARSPLRKGDYFMKLDLKDAYYAVPMHPESRKYLSSDPRISGLLVRQLPRKDSRLS